MSHMYVCLENDHRKKFVKCQTYKPIHVLKPPCNYLIEENPDISRNPFNNKTIIDCDKSFVATDIIVDEDLLATKRRNVCMELFSDILLMTRHPEHREEDLDTTELLLINHKIRAVAN